MGAPAHFESWTKKELRAAIGRRAKVSKKATKDELVAVYRSLEAAGDSAGLSAVTFAASTRSGMVAELKRLGIEHPPRATKRELTALYEACAREGRAAGPSEPARPEVSPTAEIPAEPVAQRPAESDDEPDLVFETLPPEAHAEIDAAAADPDPDFRTHRPPPDEPAADLVVAPSLSPEIRFESLPPDESSALERLAAELPSLPPSAPDALRDLEREAAERRTSERVQLEVDIGFLSETNFYVGFASDLSDGGIFIATIKLLPLGKHVLVSFMLPGGYDISTEGVVAWVREGRSFDCAVEPGMGVAFLELDGADRDAIREYTRLREPLFYLP